MNKSEPNKLNEKGGIAPPNHEYLELNFARETATGRGLNQYCIMERNCDQMKVTEGRVGVKVGPHKPRTFYRPMEEWDKIFSMKISQGYIVTKTKKMEKKTFSRSGNVLNGKEYRPIDDPDVESIVMQLLNYTNAVLSQNYTIKVDDISDEMINLGRSVLDQMAAGYTTMSVAEFNTKLKHLFMCIPRRIDNMSKVLAKRQVEFQNLLASEQELFDIMVSRVRSNQKLNSFAERPTVLEAYDLDWRAVTEEEKSYIKKRLGSNRNQYLHAWKVNNRNTEKVFEKFCNEENLTEENGISHLFHGSRNENFWSIVTTGLNINPSNVVITGKMFGNGTYFAPLAQKSLGYTSRSGSYWAGGTAPTGFLAIYKVATGKEYNPQSSDSSLNWTNLQRKSPGAHCTWAHAGQCHLVNDEVVVYKNEQSTIEYLIEMKAL